MSEKGRAKAMLAPPVKAAKAKIAPQIVLTRAPKWPQHMLWQPGVGLADRAMLRLPPQPATWDFSKIPVLPPDRAGPPQTASSLVQRKLAIGQVNDPLEQEADRIADRMMQAAPDEPSIGSAPLQLSRTCADCEGPDEAQTLRTKPSTTSGPAPGYASGPVYKAIGSAGRPLDASARTYFEPRFGHDFSRVRVHSDSVADEAAVAIDARAYAVGSHLVFAAGQYAPHTQEGKQLLAHELTHVVQQSGGEVPGLIRRQVFRPRKPEPRKPEPARPRKGKEVQPKKGAYGCTDKDLSSPAAKHCIIDRNAELFPYGGSTYLDCSSKEKQCCEVGEDEKGDPEVVICEELSEWASRRKNLRDI
jgi:hypothetical protein